MNMLKSLFLPVGFIVIILVYTALFQNMLVRGGYNLLELIMSGISFSVSVYVWFMFSRGRK